MMLAAVAPFAVLLMCGMPWLVVLGRRFGHVLAAISVLAALPLLVLASFHLSYGLGADPVWVSLGVAAAAGLVGVVLAVRAPRARPGPTAVATWLPAATGLAVWLTTLAVSPLVSGSIRGWAMRGDAGNNLRISRAMLDNHGHLLNDVQAVPLQNEFLAMAMWASRDGSAAELFAHDLYALAVMEALAIGLTGVLIGVVASSLLPAARLARRALVGALASLACTTWFVTGLPLESGYLNVHVVLPFVLACWLVFLQWRRHPRVTSVLLAALGLVILSCWAPLIIVPLGFGVALLLRVRHTVRLPSGPVPTVIVLVATAAVAVAVVPNAAAILSATSTLRSPGHGFPFTGAVLAVAIAGAFLASRRLPLGRSGVVAAGVCAITGLAILAALNVSADPPWLAYYPAKYTWLVTVLMLAILTAVLVRLVDFLPGRAAMLATTGLLAFTLLASTVGPQPLRENFVIRQPLAIILTDAVFTEGERSVDTIIEYNGSPAIELQWGTGSPDEAFINFWALEFKGSGPNQADQGPRYFTMSSYQKLRDTGSYEPSHPAMLCSVVTSLGGSAIVHTRDRDLSDVLLEQCPGVSFDVRLDLPPLDVAQGDRE